MNTNHSFTIRPINKTRELKLDSVYHSNDTLSKRTYGPFLFANGKGLVSFLPLTVKQQYNSHHPYGWNDGSLFPANGYQSQVSFGFHSKLGSFTLQLQPEFVYAQNANFNSFPASHDENIWRIYYSTILNASDAPEKFGKGAIVRMFPGQSSIRFNKKNFSIGLSTENLWWGPGVRNSLIMSNNAPGFPHITFNTTAPVHSPIGSFEGQLLSGLLKGSGYLPTDTSRRFNGEQLYIIKSNSNRYLNGVVFTWQPKWTKGLYLGFSRIFYLYRDQMKSSFNDYFPVIGHFFKGDLNEAMVEDAKKRDQILSFFFRLVMPKEKAELYAELGRNDHSGNARDLVLEPEHSRAYIAGFRKSFETKDKNTSVELLAEVTNLQVPLTSLVREQSSWYAHHLVRHGYTHEGQGIGAGIGSGANSQTVGLSLINGVNKTGLLLERVIHNNDFYFTAFAPTREYLRHWVDLSVQLNKSWQHKQFLFDARITWIKSLNYQWQERLDVQNFQPALSVSYLFR